MSLAAIERVASGMRAVFVIWAAANTEKAYEEYFCIRVTKVWSADVISPFSCDSNRISLDCTSQYNRAKR